MPLAAAHSPIAFTCSGGLDGAGRLDGETNTSNLVRSVHAASSCSTTPGTAGLIGRAITGTPPASAMTLGVGGPVRGGKKRLVTVVEQRGEGLEHGLLAAIGDEHLVGGHLVAGVAGGLRGDGGPELGRPAAGVYLCIFGSAPRAWRLDDVVGSRESASPAPTDDRPAGRLSALAFRLRPGSPIRYGGHAGRYSRRWHAPWCHFRSRMYHVFPESDNLSPVEALAFRAAPATATTRL